MYLGIKSLYGTVIFASSLTLISCKKDDPNTGQLPSIVWKSGGVYTNRDTTVSKGTLVTLGVNATKGSANDPLTLLQLKRSFDGGSDSVILSVNLSGNMGDATTLDYPVATRSVAGSERYTFWITDKYGLNNQVSLVITTKQ
ncbi:MAG: hypothetical protein JST52_08495 [Bacteroidetes bacterium]|nr:hypothetical protein [Bacteroidota bacterium]MBS1740986.1 hypothetical protein [Bacteroidota bacterium]